MKNWPSARDPNLLTNEQIKKLLTPTIQVRTTNKDLVETFENYLAMIDFVFGLESVLCKKIDQVLQLLHKQRRPVAVHCARDREFIAGLMSMIDILCKSS